MSRKRKKNKGNPAGGGSHGSNPSNDLYDHPSVGAARGRKDSNTPGGVPKASERRNRWGMDTDTLVLLTIVLFCLGFLVPLWVTVGTLIAGALGELIVARLLRRPWDINAVARFTINFGLVFANIAAIAFIVSWLSAL